MSSVAVIATITLGALVAFSPASAAAFSKDLRQAIVTTKIRRHRPTR